jgi:hypothetical protein
LPSAKLSHSETSDPQSMPVTLLSHTLLWHVGCCTDVSWVFSRGMSIAGIPKIMYYSLDEKIASSCISARYSKL